jgi:hypothetical protein
MPLILSGSVNISGSMTATTILVSSPGGGGMVSSSAQITELAPLMAYTASLKGAAIVSSSQQIQNYFTFARTGSVNTFYGNQTISGGNLGVGTNDPFSDTGFVSTYIGGSSGGQLILGLTAGGAGNRYLLLQGDSAASSILSVGSRPLDIYTNSNVRMRITGAGQTQITGSLSIAGTNNQTRFYLQNSDGDAYLSFTEQEMRMWRADGSGSDLSLATQVISGTFGAGAGAISFKPANTERMRISTNGNVGAPNGSNIYNASDARLKQNILSINGGLDSVLALNPVKFNWIDGFEPSEDGKDMLGFVAQEVQTIVPEAVESFGANSIFVGETEIDNPLRVNEKFLIPVLTKAIQEQQAIIDGLIARIEALENN